MAALIAGTAMIYEKYVLQALLPPAIAIAVVYVMS